MTRATINAGICGFKTVVRAEADENLIVTFDIETDCDTIRRLADALPPVDSYAEIGDGFDGQIHPVVRDTLKGCCSGCVVSWGIFESMQVAARLALPAPISIDIVA